MEKEIKKNNKILNLPFLEIEPPLSKIPASFGEKASDNLTKWAGSWTFILLFLGFLVLWIIINTSWIIFGNKWDPYPFILLNLALSCLAAIQAPIILMSQNREAKKDRQRAQYDYAVNRKAERENVEIIKQLERIERKISKK
jgi:uncharacterized membrane protein